MPPKPETHSPILRSLPGTTLPVGNRRLAASGSPRGPGRSRPRPRAIAAVLTPVGITLGIALGSCAGPAARGPEPPARPPQAGEASPAAPAGESSPAADTPLASAAPKEEFEAIARRLYEGHNRYVGTADLDDLKRRLAEVGLSGEERYRTLLELSSEQLEAGDTASATESVDRAYELIRAVMPSLPRTARTEDLLADLYMRRAVAYLRHAETTNCVAMHDARSCILPIRRGGVHAIAEPARQARGSLEAYLRLRPADLGARWLLNIVAMTLGDYPDAVPGELLIPPAAFEPPPDAEARGLREMPDIAPGLGVNRFDMAGGVVVEDLDGDGFLDIAVSTSDPSGPLGLYRSLGDGRFSDIAPATGLAGQLGGLNMIDADYDNDGDADLLVLRGGWQMSDGAIRKSLLRNDGASGFTDVTREAGLDAPACPTQTAAWGDYDNDGDLDLYVGCEISGSPERPGPPYPAQLFVNGGDGTFRETARDAGVANDRLAKGVCAGDYDNDGDMDIYVSNIGVNRLYRNDLLPREDGSGERAAMRFKDVAEEAGVTGPEARSFACWFFDYDNDGWLDLFVAAYDATIDDVAADTLGMPFQAGTPRLYRNQGDGTFSDAAAAAGLAHAWRPMGANFGDIDQDGWLDIYLGTGDPKFSSLMPNVMLRNEEGRRFEDVTFATGLGHLQKGHGIGFADIDNDGDQDIYHQLGGFFPGDAFTNALFLNPGGGGRFLDLRLVGRTSNRSGVGARVELTVETSTGERRIHRAPGSVSSFGGSPVLRQEIGLGDALRIRRLDVWWPASGNRTTYRDLPIDSFVEIREGSPRVRKLTLRKLMLAPEAGGS